MKIGYARVSTDDQNTDAQRLALQAAGCVRIVEEKAGGATRRPALDELLATLPKGAQLVVWRLDRLGRSLADLINIVERIEARGGHFASLTENIDTATSGGRLTFHLMGAMAQFERDLIRERTKAGMGAAKARGVHVGRPLAFTPQKLEHAQKLLQAGERPRDVARTLGVAPSTLRNHLARLKPA